MWDLRFIILNSLEDIDSNKYGGIEITVPQPAQNYRIYKHHMSMAPNHSLSNIKRSLDIGSDRLSRQSRWLKLLCVAQ